MWIDVSTLLEVVKKLVSHGNVYQYMTDAEEEFNNQVVLMLHLVVSQLLFTDISVIVQRAHEQSSDKMRYINGLGNIDFHSPSLHWLHLYSECQLCLQHRPVLSS